MTLLDRGSPHDFAILVILSRLGEDEDEASMAIKGKRQDAESLVQTPATIWCNPQSR